MTEQFTDKVVLVTGGSLGIGRATALAFGEAGAKVVIAARRMAESEEVVALIKTTGGEASFVQTDVSKANEVSSVDGDGSRTLWSTRLRL